ncbi:MULTISPECIES: hypothetical protein [unclassified Pantoea]|uniref:hypothetical protein n=1 Tax=unclassified Pantoea TaxID=2630326 RepID=UPI001CD716C4|nr:MULTISPECIES: hypothetical protein [unclassified Pantoea]MCA1179944.1 hypothetical protein [Pantoea sp. alder69]MCA1253973.1 hypothetical protein [Pantoea sp. alder70]MCA1268442.1 hypothetical protein [Pantoea sp. alder81]
MLFTGFTRCCYPYQKFDSVDGELRLAQVLEQDQTVIKWMKPSPGQFRIEYLSGQNYEPDFVVETENRFLLMEPKNAKELESLDVIAKAKAATRWCHYANEKAAKIDGKHWHYVLLPHDSITLSRSVDGLLKEFEYHD